jgi:predicted nucleotidyltransferase
VEFVAAVRRDALFAILEQASLALERRRIPFVVGGGLAAEAYHLRETVNDVDLFVRPVDAPRALDALAESGFYVWIEDPRWLYKALKSDVSVDIIYESTGVVHVGDETFRRARWMTIDHTRLPIMPPEDLFVMKAAAATPSAPKHWLDAISLLASEPMDWEYLSSRATRNPRKVLQAIVHAYEDGVPVPSFVFVRLAQDLIR